MEIDTINQSVEALSRILMTATEQTSNLNEKLLKVNTEQMVRGVTGDHMGTLIDTYA